MACGSVKLEQSGWDSDDSIGYYARHRNRPEDLYPSEQFFLPDTVRRVNNCLDVGCAAGGFSQVVRAFNPQARYVGVDVARGMVKRASKAYPSSTFLLTDGVRLPFRDEAFDLVHSSGILHLNSAYRDIVTNCYAASRRFLIVDFRISPHGRGETGTFEIRFDAGQDAAGVLPYIILNLADHVDFLTDLTPAPSKIRARGYLHPPSETASVSHREVVMAVFIIEKPANGASGTCLEIDLPCH
jgi:SAM-dependent methyltransferase